MKHPLMIGLTLALCTAACASAPTAANAPSPKNSAQRRSLDEQRMSNVAEELKTTRTPSRSLLRGCAVKAARSACGSVAERR